MPDAALPDSGPADAVAPPGIDVTRPSIARVYDYWLGGKDNFASDRKLGDQMLALDPGFRDLVRGNRDFLRAAVTQAARDGGIGQFLDLGAGLPASPAMHDAARAVLPGARFAYVDNDPVAALHTQAILAGGNGVMAVDADLADPASVLAHPATLRVLDLAEPAGIILGSVGHFLSPAVMRDLVGEYLSRCAVGSWLIISLGRAEDDEPEETLQPAYTAAQTYRYSPSDFAALFAGTAVVPPGLREARAWVAGRASPPPSKGLFMHCGAGVKRALPARHVRRRPGPPQRAGRVPAQRAGQVASVLGQGVVWLQVRVGQRPVQVEVSLSLRSTWPRAISSDRSARKL
jgi:hypothetical protein